jgi:sugar phosphate isomerase/epimerase
MLSNLHLPLEEALDAVVKMGVPAVQLRVAKDDDDTQLQTMKRAVAARGLKVSAICVDAGDLGETDANSPLFKTMKPLIDAATVLCEEGETAICQTHIGIMPHTMKGARWDSFVSGCRSLAEYSHSVGAVLAMETGPEPARVMEALIKEVDSPGLGVNYDPANFIIWPAVLARSDEFVSKTETPVKPYDREEAWREYEPVEGVRRLGPYIVHTHAKDGIGNGGWADVPLGTGWVDWPQYLRLLQEVGYDGYLAIEREAGPDPVGEITHAANFLKEQLKNLES